MEGLSEFEPLFREHVTRAVAAQAFDPAHDLLHLDRVIGNARIIARSENAALEIVLPAAWFHDVVIVPKDDPRRAQASRLSAREAIRLLAEMGYPSEYFEAIAHAIEAHSYSAGIDPQTLEAKVVQDSDRLDGLGAVGVARCFATAGALKRAFYSPQDPFCRERQPEDSDFTIDHFYQKLFKTASTLRTETARQMGLERVAAMTDFLAQFERELAFGARR